MARETCYVVNMKPARAFVYLLTIAVACAGGAVAVRSGSTASGRSAPERPVLRMPAAAPGLSQEHSSARSFRSHREIAYLQIAPHPDSARSAEPALPPNSASIAVSAVVLPTHIVTFRAGRAVRMQSNTLAADARDSIWMAVDSHGKPLEWTEPRWRALLGAHPPRGAGIYPL